MNPSDTRFLSRRLSLYARSATAPTPVRTSGANPDKGIGTGGPSPGLRLSLPRFEALPGGRG